MYTLLRSALIGALALAPASAFAQMVIQEPAPLVGEPAVVIQQPAPAPVVVQQPATVVVPAPVPAGPIGPEDARAIAMMNGLVTVEDVNTRWRDGDFEVDGEDASGNEMEIRIDAETGAVLEIDD